MLDTGHTDVHAPFGARSRLRNSMAPAMALLALCAATVGKPASAGAQGAWPAQQVTFVVAFAPGGPADIVVILPP